MFLVDDEEMSSPVYKAFWNALRDGKARTGEVKRRGKGGKEVWIRGERIAFRFDCCL
jgi:methyl-accepting chemotaxis protein